MTRGPSLTISDVAARVALSVGHCRTLVAAGELPPPYGQGRGARFWASDVAMYLACRAARKRRERRRRSGA
jgi:hypothetical protein